MKYHNIHSITTPTAKRTRFSSASDPNDVGYANQLITSPVKVDPHLERDLSGLLN